MSYMNRRYTPQGIIQQKAPAIQPSIQRNPVQVAPQAANVTVPQNGGYPVQTGFQTAPGMNAPPVNFGGQSDPGSPAQPQTPQPQAPQTSQAPNPRNQIQTPPSRGNADYYTAEQKTDPYFISQKIWKIGSTGKLLDFTSSLSKAYLKDFANIHGCGGRDHAYNSTIGITICDYSEGTGENSVSVRYPLDVEDYPILLDAALAARRGALPAPVDPKMAAALTGQIASISSFDHGREDSLLVPGKSLRAILETAKQLAQPGSVPNPATTAQVIVQQLTALGKEAKNAANAFIVPGNTLQSVYNLSSSLYEGMSKPGEAFYTYTREKNNPYAKWTQGKTTYAPVSKITIRFVPIRKDGDVNNNPWNIYIENFDAPLSVKDNGTTAHISTQAINRKVCFMNLSTDNFIEALVAVDRFVRLWEHQMLPVMEEAYRQLDDERKKRNAVNCS